MFSVFSFSYCASCFTLLHFVTSLGFVNLMRGGRMLAKRKLPTEDADLCLPSMRGGKMHLPCQLLMALVNVNLLPNGSAIDMSLVPQGICSIPGRAYL